MALESNSASSNAPEEVQIKIGRLSILGSTTSDDVVTYNEYSAFMPESGITTDGTENHFSIYGERFLFKKKEDLNLVFGHICTHGQYYDFGVSNPQTSIDEFCKPCAAKAGNLRASDSYLVSLLPQGQCYSCDSLNVMQNNQGEIATAAKFFYEAYCIDPVVEEPDDP